MQAPGVSNQAATARQRAAQAERELFRAQTLEELAATRGITYLPLEPECTVYAAACDGRLSGYIRTSAPRGGVRPRAGVGHPGRPGGCVRHGAGGGCRAGASRRRALRPQVPRGRVWYRWHRLRGAPIGKRDLWATGIMGPAPQAAPPTPPFPPTPTVTRAKTPSNTPARGV